MTGVAVAPVPVESVMVTIGALYPVPPLVTVMLEIELEPGSIFAEARAPDPVPHTSVMVTVGEVYPEPFVLTVMFVIDPFGTGLFA